ncbi:ribonuclease R [Vagococcus carniphilus]|uniref:Ribonuclease R n=2 Tax=Vagococcus carniphilus TaxID=218144 RepID=A0AAW8U5K1_9ENTE|nr:ribonuclease R [Vagococcus carniphilus]MDT2815602.1 ribonuclease R [Vagococcus carniphilus]MDT2830764.1 ribonuclease R [Vagococcus carniphilus]MDT2833067.1 ribonuclease R [Vagococcus carniphilus]MDT2839464.1 ribonuclease R [Vagococcus carniphilus]MDT2853927.1 ribonuclease R [Vagococcus carniphilus]
MTNNIKETILNFMSESKKQTFSLEQIAEGLKFQKSKDFKLLVQTIAQMEREGSILFNQKGKIKLNKQEKFMEGLFRANDRGFGFVSIEGEDDDIFIPKDFTNFALEGDKVKIEILKQGSPMEDQAAEGKVVEVIERNTTQIVGIFTLYSDADIQKSELYGVVIPKDKKLSRYRLFVANEGIKPEDGSVVVAEVTFYPDSEHTSSFEGIVKQVIGHKNDPGMDILSIVLQHGIPTKFEESTLKEAESLPDVVLDSELEGRVDLRNETIVTIDGEEAKDLDDAVRVEKLDNGNYFLGVYIADVSHYVTENSPLDMEASDRATSVYLTDRVIPMLPRKLSNGICSLNPNVDRLVMACEMEINGEGQVISHDIFEAVIHSTARMTYTAVNEILEKSNEETLKEYQALIPYFENMAELHDILETMRKNRGAISFEDREAKIIVDDAGHPIDIELRERKVAERLIESFMLAANETVARHYTKLKLPFIYRIHEHPKEEKVQRFFEFVTNFGILVRGKKDDVSPKELQKVLDKIAGKPEEPVVSMMLLRSMQQARYSEDPVGHYGLAAEDYTHFTSPIRRYPDLIVHRLIKSYMAKPIKDEVKSKWDEVLPDIADHSSKMERRAVEAERDTDNMKKAEFMVDKVDQEFDGIITSITKFGMFVELPNTIEGLIHVSQLKNDYFHFVETHLALVGERTGTIYKIGQAVKIKVTKADVDTREIDFELLSAEPITTPIDIPKQQKNNNRKTDRKRQQGSKPGYRNEKKTGGKKKSNQPFYKKVAKKKKGKSSRNKMR